MKNLLITLSILFSLNTAFAETYVCKFRPWGDPMRAKFEFDSSMERARVTIYRSNRIQISHEVAGSSEGSGDGWDIVLIDRSHEQYRYQLFFNAMDLYSLVLKIPGMPRIETDDCRRL